MRAILDFVESEVANEAQNAPADPSRLNKHRALWSFLTRSVFLGQMVVAQQFIGGSATAASTNDDATKKGTSADDAAGARPGTANLQGTAGADNAGAASPVNTTQAGTGPTAQPKPFDAVDVAANGATSTDGARTGGDSQSLAGQSADQAAADVAVGELPQGEAPVDPTGPGIHIPIETIVETVGDTVVTITQVVDNTIVQVAELVDVTVDTVLATVGQTVDTLFDVLHASTASLPLVGPALAEVTQVLDDVVSPTLTSLTSTLSGTVDVLTDTVADAGGIFSAIGDAVGSDVIPALTGPVSNILTSPYSENGIHTDFGLALQSDIVAPIDSIVSSVKSVADTLFDGLGDLGDDDHGSVGNLAFGLTSPLNELKGGLGELLS